MFKYLYILIASVLLVGCGGAGSDSDNQSSASSQSSTRSIQAAVPIAASQTVSSAANLSTSTGFTFSNQHNLSLDLRLSAFAGVRTMVNICLPQASTTSSYDVHSASIDYQQCLYKTTINNGELITTFVAAKHNDHLILELRPYTNLATATNFHWQSSDGLYWFIR